MKKVIIILLCFLSLTLDVYGQEQKSPEEIYSEYYSAAGVEDIKKSLDETTLTELKELGADPKNYKKNGVYAKDVFESLWNRLKEGFLSPFTSLCTVFCAVVLCSAFGLIGKKTFSQTADFTAAVCICSIAVVPFCSAICSAVEAIRVCCGFMAAFIPVYCGILLSLGRAAFSVSANALTFGAAQFVSGLAGTVIIPFSGMYLALSVASAFCHDISLSSLVGGIKKAVFWALGISMTVFSALLCVTGAVNSSADTVSGRTAKFFLSNSLPVVGGALTDALETVAGCLSALKSGVGAYGICGIILLLFPSVIQIVLWRGSLSAMSAVSGFFGQKRCQELLKGLSEGAGIILSVSVCVAILFLISLTVLLMGGNGI